MKERAIIITVLTNIQTEKMKVNLNSNMKTALKGKQSVGLKVSTGVNKPKNKKALKNQGFQSRGRGDRTPVNGFGDRRTTAVLFPYKG